MVAVQAANSPIVTSESLKLAREIDPEGRRTLAVVTKLDLLDPSLDTYEILTGAFLKNEVIGVVNRSYQDVVNFKTMAAQIKDEAEFLREQYPMLSNKSGTPYLADTLNRLYLEQVRIAWPTIKSHISDQILVNLDDKEGTLLEILAKFRITYCRSRKFKNAEIQKNSQESFSSTLDEIGPLTGLNKSHIQAAINSHAGKKDPLIMAFKFLVKKQIDLLTEPSLDCVRMVVEEMQEIAKNCTAELQGDIARFPKLRREIGQAMKELIDERMQVLNGLVENFIQSEMGGLTTTLLDCCNRAIKLLQERERRGFKLFGVRISSQKSTQRRIEKECVLIENLIGDVFLYVRKAVQEYVMEKIASTLIDYLQENLEAELVTRLGKPEKIEEVMIDRDLCGEREKAAKLVKVRFN